MSAPRFRTWSEFTEHPAEEMRARARAFREEMLRRRTIRDFDSRPVPGGVIEDCLAAANSAPSGANRQPWHFVVVRDAAVKRRIRVAAEEEEREFYAHRAPDEWLEALAPLGTDADKPFLETAPCLVVVFAQLHGVDAEGRPLKHYYVNESVGIATGILITALHHAGLATLTHTPAPMRFLNEILDRPRHERPYLILVTGFPAPGARVPDIEKKPVETVASFR
ncbi:MAG: nitroreductase family protein [Thermoanaerobaculia bacterium]